MLKYFPSSARFLIISGFVAVYNLFKNVSEVRLHDSPIFVQHEKLDVHKW